MTLTLQEKGGGILYSFVYWHQMIEDCACALLVSLKSIIGALVAISLVEPIHPMYSDGRGPCPIPSTEVRSTILSMGRIRTDVCKR